MSVAGASAHRLCWALLLLLVFYTAGVIVFRSVERHAELQTYAENRQLYEKMKDLYSFAHCEDPAFEKLSFCKDQKKFSESLLTYFNQHGNSMVDLERWTILGSVFFLTQMSTTIGYGNSHPQTHFGQLATICFALVGIPIMGYTLVQVARLELHAIVKVVEKLTRVNMSLFRRQMLVLWCLLFFFMFGGAGIYRLLEPWSYSESLYFCFVTLSTVGFGDYLPSSDLSKIFSIAYMMSGLGVCMLIIAVLTGLVAEGHDNVDNYLTKKISEGCGDACCCIGGKEDSPRTAA